MKLDLPEGSGEAIMLEYDLGSPFMLGIVIVDVYKRQLPRGVSTALVRRASMIFCESVPPAALMASSRAMVAE